ncbi:hypothetical protein PLEOSDRAFT_1105564 [Pleurotus ostreatus PC15]|uniref:Uncharacterized protein n=1 Tax=Pleurotus ostreatus (strain PC15) TaxID=1137138 RepID=A0A067NF37_PLEO1|nr:hypothetical protein PLEOSDRAFT_1105564 [Pleurotus ostreatus PC15]
MPGLITALSLTKDHYLQCDMQVAIELPIELVCHIVDCLSEEYLISRDYDDPFFLRPIYIPDLVGIVYVGFTSLARFSLKGTKNRFTRGSPCASHLPISADTLCNWSCP